MVYAKECSMFSSKTFIVPGLTFTSLVHFEIFLCMVLVCPFHPRGLKCKSRSLGISRVTGKFGLRVENEVGQRLTEFRQKNTLVIANILYQDSCTRGHH